MLLASLRRRRSPFLSHSLHVRFPFFLIRTFASEYSCPFGQWVLDNQKLRAFVKPTPRKQFSRCVTGSKWAGLMQQRTRHLGSSVSPFGIGPTRTSYEARWARANFCFPFSLPRVT